MDNQLENYQENEKIIVRKEALVNAIKYLTEDRSSTTIANISYLRDAKKALIDKAKKNNSGYCDIANELSDKTIERWENFYNSIVHEKKASDLKIAYLCGPTPMNDLKIMIDVGILPENVWAFELDTLEYDKAVLSALNSEYPYLKIIKGDMSTFFEYTPLKFDIIYFDACAPIPSPSSKTLKAVVSTLENHKLNSPGVLITNFSLPTKKQDEHTRKSISNIVATYLYPKGFLEKDEEGEDNYCIEGAEVYGYEYGGSWNKLVDENLESFYGQYITRFINDIGSIIVPYQKFFKNKKFLKIFFKNVFDEKKHDKLNKLLETHLERHEENVEVDTMLYSALWSLLKVSEMSPKNSFDKAFINELSVLKNNEEFLNSIKFMYFILDEMVGEKNFYSDSLLNISQNWKPFKRHYLCDVFLFHQIKELLIRQLCVPYHLNVEKTLRWTYKAKETQMFTDLLVFDECRYLYDWIPTLDMIEANLNNIEMDLSLRLILDSISKHTIRCNNDYFYGTSAIDIGTKGFEEKTLKIRKKIKS